MEKFKIALAYMVAIALAAAPFINGRSVYAEVNCPDDLDGITLSNDQQARLQRLEAELDQQIEAILPASPETEARIEQLEETHEQQISALLTPQQEQQIEQLEEWLEQQELRIIPELARDEDIEPTAAQEAQFEAIEQEFEQRYRNLLTANQRQQLDALEAQLDAAIEAAEPQPTLEQEAHIHALEAAFEWNRVQLLTPGQQQQLERNLSCWDEE